MNRNAERQRAFRARKAAAGLVQVTGFVHQSQLAEVQMLFRQLASDRNLTVGPVRHEPSGKLRKLRITA